MPRAVDASGTDVGLQGAKSPRYRGFRKRTGPDSDPRPSARERLRGTFLWKRTGNPHEHRVCAPPVSGSPSRFRRFAVDSGGFGHKAGACARHESRLSRIPVNAVPNSRSSRPPRSRRRCAGAPGRSGRSPALVSEPVAEGEERVGRVVRNVGELAAHRLHRGRELERQWPVGSAAAEDDVEHRRIARAEVGEQGSRCRRRSRG